MLEAAPSPQGATRFKFFFVGEFYLMSLHYSPIMTLLKNKELALGILGEEIERYEDSLWLYVRRSALSISHNDCVLNTRFGVLEYLASAYCLQDATRFNEASKALLLHCEALSRKYKWTPEIILVEMSVALMTGNINLANSLATVLVEGAKCEFAYIERFQSVSLAALVLGDHAHALNVLYDLLTFIETSKLKRFEREQGAFWADAVKHVTCGDYENAQASINQLTSLHAQGVNRELAKLKRGGHTPISSLDFMDFAVLGLSAHMPWQVQDRL